MKTLRVALVAALVAGCHFDKLFNSAPGGSHAPPPGSSSTRLAFTAPPSDAMKDSIIQPPVRVTAYDAFGNQATNFTGSVLVAIGHNGGVLVPGTLSGNGAVPAVNGVATFSNLSIDIVGNGYTLTAAFAGGAVVIESPAFNITVL